MILCPLLPAFFSKFPIILWNIVLALSFCHFSFLFPCNFFLFLLFCRCMRCFYDILFPQAIFIPPPLRGGGGGVIFQYINPCNQLFWSFLEFRNITALEHLKFCSPSTCAVSLGKVRLHDKYNILHILNRLTYIGRRLRSRWLSMRGRRPGSRSWSSSACRTLSRGRT